MLSLIFVYFQPNLEWNGRGRIFFVQLLLLCSWHGLCRGVNLYNYPSLELPILQAALKTIGEEDKYFSRVSLR